MYHGLMVHSRDTTSTLVEAHQKYRTAILALFLFSAFVLCMPVHAGTYEQAKRMHERLTGVPPTFLVLKSMETEIFAGRPLKAAAIAMQNRYFYDSTLKTWVTPWTNEEENVFAPLNDYTATVIGMIRDDVPFNTLLSADILYKGSSAQLPAYSTSNNAHYQAIEDQGLSLKNELIQVTQSAETGLLANATAGVITTRAAAKAFFVGGTNRAMLRFTLKNHLCTDLEQIQDNTRPADRVRQDVSRSPGGDSRIFMNACVGCHSGMDPLTQAYAYYHYDEQLGQMLYTPNTVQPKYLINSNNFKTGYITPNDRWDNYWRQGPNSRLKWSQALSGYGNGAKSMGEELANSHQFAQCQVEKVFETICLRSPSDQYDRDKVAQITASFKNSNYKMKQVFAETAVYCMGN